LDDVEAKRLNGTAANPTVLLVEDDSAIRETLAECLEFEGYGVVATSNGREALDQLEDGLRPQVVVLDLVMPVMTGDDLIEAIRANHRLAGIPLVLMTAAMPGAAMRLPDADLYLPKPFELKALLAAVQRFCGQPAA
jgi:CheY-like chemotaxis protein